MERRFKKDLTLNNLLATEGSAGDLLNLIVSLSAEELNKLAERKLTLLKIANFPLDSLTELFGPEKGKWV